MSGIDTVDGDFELRPTGPAIAPAAARQTRHIPHLAVAFLVAFAEILAATLSMIASHYAYHHYFKGMSPAGLGAAAITGVAVGIITVGFQAARDGYSIEALLNHRRRLLLGLQSWLFAFFVIGWLAFLTKTTAGFSRVAVTGFFVFGFLLVSATRLTLLAVIARSVQQANLSLRSAFLIMAGDQRAASRKVRLLARQGISVVGTRLLAADAPNEAIDACREALRNNRFDEIHVFAPWSQTAVIARLREGFRRLPVPVYLFADVEAARLVEGRRLDIGRHVAFEIQRAPLSLFERFVKRAMDIVIAGLLLLLLSPLLLLVSLAIMLESGRPVLFRQSRRGFGGRRFVIFKFRSMYVCEDGPDIAQARRGDARITPLGRILRKTSIDELPQLWNVVQGDMSLVGPRPHAVAHDDKYEELISTYANRHHVKPGLTGWAQVNGFRGETSTLEQMQARVDHDLWYVNNWSALLDLRIILQTGLIMLFDRNAY
ncbi:MAG: undecaprenyl-phosphate glucose phosphotransferase [Hyphomicrobiales bacterium]